MSTEALIRDFLRASAGTLSTASAAFYVGPMQKSGNGIPTVSIFSHISGGPPVQSFLGGNDVTPDQLIQTGRVYVRGAPRTYIATQARAELVIRTLHHAALGGVVRISAEASAPLYWGPNSLGEEEFSIPIEVIRE